MRSCGTAAGCGALLGVLLVAGYLYRDDVVRLAAEVIPGIEAPAGPVETGGAALGRRVEDRIVALGQGEIDEVVLTEEEVNAWIEHGLRGFFPEYLSDVLADLTGEKIELSGRVAVRQVPGIERLGMMAAFLTDTADVSAAGRVDGLGSGRGVFRVDAVRVGAVPLPDPMRDQLLVAIRGQTGDRSQGNAIAFPLPEFVTDVAVREGRLVLRGGGSAER